MHKVSVWVRCKQADVKKEVNKTRPLLRATCNASLVHHCPRQNLQPRLPPASRMDQVAGVL